jgi:hypothetical protein
MTMVSMKWFAAIIGWALMGFSSAMAAPVSKAPKAAVEGGPYFEAGASAPVRFLIDRRAYYAKHEDMVLTLTDEREGPAKKVFQLKAHTLERFGTCVSVKDGLLVQLLSVHEHEALGSVLALRFEPLMQKFVATPLLSGVDGPQDTKAWMHCPSKGWCACTYEAVFEQRQHVFETFARSVFSVLASGEEAAPEPYFPSMAFDTLPGAQAALCGQAAFVPLTNLGLKSHTMHIRDEDLQTVLSEIAAFEPQQVPQRVPQRGHPWQDFWESWTTLKSNPFRVQALETGTFEVKTIYAGGRDVSWSAALYRRKGEPVWRLLHAIAEGGRYGHAPLELLKVRHATQVKISLCVKDCRSDLQPDGDNVSDWWLDMDKQRLVPVLPLKQACHQAQ